MKALFPALLLLLTTLPVAAEVDADAASFPRQSLVMQGLQGTLWVQTSVEHAALCQQAFAAAASRLDAALADPAWSAALEQGQDPARLPPAIIVDIDETVLDNSPFQGALLNEGRVFDPALFDVWVAAARAKPVPGALAFLKAAQQRGVAIFYVTNRNAMQEAATRDNLAREGFPLTDKIDTLLMRKEYPGWGWDKTSRRALIARGHRVLMLFGDDFNDFVGDSRTTLQRRRQLSAEHSDWWGERWFMLPNPSYGSWLGAINDYEWGIGDADKQRMRERLLKVFKP